MLAFGLPKVKARDATAATSSHLGICQILWFTSGPYIPYFCLAYSPSNKSQRHDRGGKSDEDEIRDELAGNDGELEDVCLRQRVCRQHGVGSVSGRAALQ
jgi:hypothetical protein